MPENLEDKLAKIQRLSMEVMRKCAGTISAGDSMYFSSFVIIGAVKRSLALSKGFCTLIRDKNFTSAAALLRLQLDTALRLRAALLYDGSYEEFARRVFHGEPMNKMKAADGKKMTDSYVAESMNAEHPWVKEVYGQLRDFVHFSDRHIFSATHHTDDEIRTVYFQVSAEDSPRPTRIILRSWTAT